jgi:polysaccharide export outer membrane protein
LHITVFDHDELTIDARVSQSGNITFPMIGQQRVSGLPTREAEVALSNQLNAGGFLRAPQVSINITEFKSQKVAVMGQVTNAGQYALDGPKKVLDALAMAGGMLNDNSAAAEGTLVRADGSRISIDFDKLLTGDPAMNLRIHDGDTLYVPLAPQFFIYGQVQHPGAYRLSRNTTISQAVSIGGGLTPRGTQRGAIVKRFDSQGNERRLHPKEEEVLQANDVLLIKASLF